MPSISSTSSKEYTEPAGLIYRDKLKDLVKLIGGEFVSNKNSVTLSPPVPKSAPPICIEVPLPYIVELPPDNLGEKGIDAFYKKLYYYFVAKCGGDFGLLHENNFGAYKVRNIASPTTTPILTLYKIKK